LIKTAVEEKVKAVVTSKILKNVNDVFKKNQKRIHCITGST
jgi:hypothetical protein